MNEVRRFGETTTMKGVPRAVKADTGFLRLLWAIAVLSFLGLSIYQTTLLLVDFLQFGSVTEVSEALLDPFSTRHGGAIPDINLCNLNPLASNTATSQAAGIPTLGEYYRQVMMETEGCSSTGGCSSDNIAQQLLTLEGYYRYLGTAAAASVGHSAQSMILSCHIYVIDGIGKRRMPCADYIRYSHFQTSRYFQCVNVHVGHREPSGILGVSLVLFLDNLMNNKTSDDDIAHDDDDELSAGLIVGLGTRNSLPSITINTVTVPPGQKADIGITPKKRTRLPPPHGNCDKDAPTYQQGLDSQLPFEYAFTSCLMVCLERHVRQQCGCVVGRDGDLKVYENLTVDYCGDLKAGWQKAIASVNCSETIREYKVKACLEECPRPCSTHFYSMGISEANWPMKSRLMAIHKKYIKGRPYEKHFFMFEELSRDSKLGNLTESDVRWGVASQLIHENFVHLSISLKEYRYISMVQTVKTTTEGLVSQIGGILNLWSGITAIILIELLEMIYRLWNGLFSNPRKGSLAVRDKPAQEDIQLDNTGSSPTKA